MHRTRPVSGGTGGRVYVERRKIRDIEGDVMNVAEYISGKCEILQYRELLQLQ